MRKEMTVFKTTEKNQMSFFVAFMSHKHVMYVIKVICICFKLQNQHPLQVHFRIFFILKSKARYRMDINLFLKILFYADAANL